MALVAEHPSPSTEFSTGSGKRRSAEAVPVTATLSPPLRPQRALRETYLPAQSPQASQDARLPEADVDARGSRDHQTPTRTRPPAALRPTRVAAAETKGRPRAL